MNLENAYLLIIAVAIITFIFRALPFLFNFLLAHNATIRTVQHYLPASIMLLLILYTLKDLHGLSSPDSVIALCAIVAIVGVHCWLRNALLSMTVGTLIYVIGVNYC